MASIGLSLAIVPRQVMPWTGLFLMYEWTFTIFFLLFKCYLHLIYQWGRAQSASYAFRPEPSDYDSRKGFFSLCAYFIFSNIADFFYIIFILYISFNWCSSLNLGHQRQVSSCDAATWCYMLGMAFLAVAAPSLPCLFGITALFMRWFAQFLNFCRSFIETIITY